MKEYVPREIQTMAGMSDEEKAELLRPRTKEERLAFKTWQQKERNKRMKMTAQELNPLEIPF